MKIIYLFLSILFSASVWAQSNDTIFEAIKAYKNKNYQKVLSLLNTPELRQDNKMLYIWIESEYAVISKIYSDDVANFDFQRLEVLRQNIDSYIANPNSNNIEKVKETMRGKTCVVSGHSGAGKSTLINAIAPQLALKTGEISLQHQQGQHTTTFAEMFDLPFGAHIIDTPGIKGFGMVEIDKHELTDYFPEFFALKEDCKFNNCLHTDEPHCAVKEALENDEIAWSRYKSYLQILEGDEESYRIMNYE